MFYNLLYNVKHIKIEIRTHTYPLYVIKYNHVRGFYFSKKT